MIVIIVIGAILLGAAAVALTFLRGPLEPETVDAPDSGLPAGDLTADDIGRLRFRVGLRGYRMEDVDRALAAVEQTLRNAETRTRRQ